DADTREPRAGEMARQVVVAAARADAAYFRRLDESRLVDRASVVVEPAHYPEVDGKCSVRHAELPDRLDDALQFLNALRAGLVADAFQAGEGLARVAPGHNQIVELGRDAFALQFMADLPGVFLLDFVEQPQHGAGFRIRNPEFL